MMFFNQIKMGKVKKVNSDVKEVSIDAKPVASTVENSSENDGVELQNDAIVDEVVSENTEPDLLGEVVIYSAPNTDTYKVEEADILRHPELAEQGVNAGDEVAYGSKVVYKYSTASKESSFPEAWPRNIEPIKQGITFKE